MAAFFYRMLPPEVAYHFKAGVPDRWLGRGFIIIWLLVPQLVFVIFGAALILSFSLLTKQLRQSGSSQTGRILSVMGNIVAMPQLILAFAILDIFLYNSYGVRLAPLWLVALVVIVVGSGIAGVGFAKVLRQAR